VERKEQGNNGSPITNEENTENWNWNWNHWTSEMKQQFTNANPTKRKTRSDRECEATRAIPTGQLSRGSWTCWGFDLGKGGRQRKGIGEKRIDSAIREE